VAGTLDELVSYTEDPEHARRKLRAHAERRRAAASAAARRRSSGGGGAAVSGAPTVVPHGAG
jgi:uncharacterized membrane protein